MIVIGHRGHVEVEGTLGQVDGTVTVISTVEQALRATVPDPRHVAYVTQTTLSVDDTRDIIAALRQRFPAIVGPETKTICYATQNRQSAVRAIAVRAERIIVCGALNSSNTVRLKEVAESVGKPALLVSSLSDLTAAFLEGTQVVGLTAGASAPEEMVQKALSQLAQWRTVRVEEVKVTEETTRFAPVDVSAAPRSAQARVLAAEHES